MPNLWIDANGCLHIKDKRVIDEIIAVWGPNPTNLCIVLDGGGGGAPANSMCSCATTVDSVNKNSDTYTEPKN